jgi:hypothetical protein
VEIWGLKGFMGIAGYRKGYLVKIGVSFIGKMYWKGGSKNNFGKNFQYLVKLGVFLNIP